MHLLDTETGQFFETNPKVATYAILSHTWDPPLSQSFPSPTILGSSDSILTSPSPPSIWDDPNLSPKIRDACAIARANGFRYIWIDSCCIDKGSSSELSESINSMHAWYAAAKVCYAFLADVVAEEDLAYPLSTFRKSRWFTRGWTLQELIAPWDVVFFSGDWRVIGSKDTLADLLEKVTGIDRGVLLHQKSLDEVSVAARLSWVAKRVTTRVEDEAYSLLGIFDINMPTLYGEGIRAFRRLQEEIMRRIPDQSLFAPGLGLLGCATPVNTAAQNDGIPHPAFIRRCQLQESSRQSLLVPSLTNFRDSGSIRVVPRHTVLRILGLSVNPPMTEYVFSPYGIRMQIPMMPISPFLPPDLPEKDRAESQDWYLAILGCESTDDPGHLLCRVVHMPASDSDVHQPVAGLAWVHMQNPSLKGFCALLSLSPDTIERCRAHIKVHTVYLSHPERGAGLSELACDRAHDEIRLIFPTTVQDALCAEGYTIELRGPDQAHPNTHLLTLSHERHIVTIEYKYSLMASGLAWKMRALVTASWKPPNWTDGTTESSASSMIS
ncbi:heterokaryon incompatibility protein-domain-containing protein [Dichomitus squalens]|uniref:Heterokaryon incompatibility protein-domain-containing protein n=1 Tax=Dichomitus squalens TaxID=114155 RepID=A0A4Q9PU90_9APHY|nr:heterokaryon incompatibility protein-domain-containing protein [Dichomitus squalens]